MKRIALLTIAGIALLMALGSANATTWLTYREDITISSGTVDIMLEYYHNGTTSQTYRNITLPCQLGQLNRTVTKFAIKANGDDLTYNLTVNGQAIKSSQTVSDGSWSNTTLANMISGGVSQSDTYLNFTFDVNNSNNIIYIHVYGDDCALLSSWLSNNIVIKEKDVTSPQVKETSTASYWTVNDSIDVSNSIGYTLYDLTLNLTYPSHKVTAPSSQKIITGLNNGSTRHLYVQYQKYGPYVYKVRDTSTAGTHEVTVYIKSNEVLTNCVDWIIKPSKDVYEGYLDNIDTDSLTIKYNGGSIDWEINDDGYIEIDDFTVRDSWSQNKFVFTWTEAAVTPVVPLAWYEQTYAGIPAWAWVTIAVIVIAIAGMAIYNKH